VFGEQEEGPEFGYAVESHDPLTVSICDASTGAAGPARARAAQVPTEVGYPAREERGQHCLECEEPMTAVEAAASRTHNWHGRCADCQAEHLAQATDTTDQD
jgi:hypothetical protein